ncbi:branched-chain amino acid aminotransferase 2, chloroplastic-like isoform X2 [Tripterygium wilfordii]|uniref:branched-chain amino acid aminotransferase 2, chloroplastic-like isoform X2 n=1 Tax=Tripterygium wilfordii TaxID=458696 RepID=UPI0018F85E8F|nr:branched-chain amino acid aminotransferase 2, chloroplastic-like isoform X2 [Tripterygium wilfordii]
MTASSQLWRAHAINRNRHFQLPREPNRKNNRDGQWEWRAPPPVEVSTKILSSALPAASPPLHPFSLNGHSPLLPFHLLSFLFLLTMSTTNRLLLLAAMLYYLTISGGNFSKGELQRFGNIELSPSAGVLNYGQGLFEGLKAYMKEGGNILLFRPEENALRIRMGAERMCMPAPTVEQFVEAVKATVMANKRWVPFPRKGSLYIRPLLMGSGAVLGVAPAPEYTFLIYVSPVGNYFKEGVAPINLVVEHELHRATPGGTGGVKMIGNYAQVLKAQSAAKAKGYSDVLYLDSVHKKYLEEVSSCNIFIVKVEERQVAVDELLDADEVFCTGTAVVVSPVGSITYMSRRLCYGEGFGVVSQQLYHKLTRLQMGLIEDSMNWTLELS